MKTALGRGLDALIPDKGDNITHIDIDRILPGMQQPRKVFNESALNELSASIKEKGVLQPILVSRSGDGSFYLIAGERRWRAATLAGLKKIPAIIKNVDSRDSLEMALIENIQREELNPIETAEGFNRLLQEFNLTQEDLADKVEDMLYAGKLSMGHARALLALEGKINQVEAARKIIKNGLSVRETELLAQKTKKSAKISRDNDPQIASLEEKLLRHLGTKVHIAQKNKKKGKIEIEYYSLEELNRLLDILMT
ncbi:MAG: ParB/RepB/Spo0J family partition protein [Nitrospirae bacterium]|nr:ParB/RepB/Spo0J family partition protein [Nitrospirota bacterium]